MSAKENSSMDSPMVCCFCNLAEDNEVKYGKFYKYNTIVTHYYCLLLSSNMEQKGNDDDGILGFLEYDILKELRRGKKLACSYCKKVGATLGCCNTKCKRMFHFPCSLRTGSLHQFFGQFKSYCVNHRLKQNIDDHILKQIKSLDSVLCYICYDMVNPNDVVETLWAPCCKKDTLFHRNCIQLLALSAGYFFKCPLCNNKKDFQNAMLENGIFIPSQDASWELVPNAFEELLYRHDQCDAIKCLCPKGRKYISSNAKWELILCQICGSQGIHMYCGHLKWANPIWKCVECTSILKKANSKVDENTESSNSSESSSHNGESDLDSDSDTDISVGIDFPTFLYPPTTFSYSSCSTSSASSTPEITLRPGPRSFKLQQQTRVEKMAKCSTELIPTALKMDEKDNQSSSKDTNKLPSKNNCENKELLTNEGNISLQENKKNNAKEERRSNNEKFQPIRKVAEVITIESDDDETKKSEPSNVSCIKLSTKPTESKSLLNAEKNSTISTDLNAISILLEKDNMNRQKPIIFNSEVPNKSESINLEQFDVPSKSTLDLIDLNSNDDLKDTNMIDTSGSSVMNIKITNVTSLSPEIFENVPNVIQEDITTHMNSINTPSSSAKMKMEKLSTRLLHPKRSMHEEANSVIDNCKKIKGSNFDKKFWEKDSMDSYSIMAHDTIRQQVRETYSNKSRKIHRNTKNLSECTFANKIYNSSLNNNGKYDSPSQFNLFNKMDIRHANQVELNYSDENSVLFNMQQNNENSIKMMSTVEHDKPVYLQIPEKLESISEPNFTTNQDVENNGNIAYIMPKNDVTLPKVIRNTTVINNHQSMLIVNQSIRPTVIRPLITNDNLIVRNEEEAALVKEKLSADVSNPDNSSSNNESCDGDAGSSAETDSTSSGRKKDLSGESCGNANATIDDDGDNTIGSPNSAPKRTFFPRVTNNYNACHQPRLIPQYMDIRNLKFRVCKPNSIQMILYDTFSVNIPVENHKEDKIRSTGPTVSRELKKSFTFASCARGEASFSLDCIEDSSSTEKFNEKLFCFSKNENHLINDKIKHVVHDRDDTKENLDPIKRMLSRNSKFENISLTNDVDDTVIVKDYVCDENDTEIRLISSDTNLNASNRTVYNANINNVADGLEFVSNNQSSRLNLEGMQQDRQASVRSVMNASTEERISGIRPFCKETNKIVYNFDFDFDLNIVKTNKNIEEVLQDDVTVSANQKVDDDKEICCNDHKDDSLMLRTDYKHLGNMNVMKLKDQNRSIARISNITYNERNILNKQINSCDSENFIQCMTFHNSINRNSENNPKHNSDFCFKISIDLCKIQNLIDSKPELFANHTYNAYNDQHHKCKSLKHGQEDYTQQQVRCEIENNITNQALKNNKLQISNYSSNIERLQIRNTLTDVNTIVRYQKSKHKIKDFDKHILNR